METVELKPIPDVEEVQPEETKPKQEKPEWESVELKEIESGDRPVLEKPRDMKVKPLKKKKHPKRVEGSGKDQPNDTEHPTEEVTSPAAPDVESAPEVCGAACICVKHVYL